MLTNFSTPYGDDDMNIVDKIIIIFLAFGALIGFKKGFTNQLVSLVGIFVILVLSYIF